MGFLLGQVERFVQDGTKYAQTLGESGSDELHKTISIRRVRTPEVVRAFRLELDKPVIEYRRSAVAEDGAALWCDIRIMAEDAYLGVYCRRWEYIT